MGITKMERRIAVVDVAAEYGGAMSVLDDFYNYVKWNDTSRTEWFFFLSVIDLEETEFIKVVKCPAVKRSWFSRLKWEVVDFPKLVGKYRITDVFSLQNKALPVRNIKQTVYFHNALHFLKPAAFHFFDKAERENFIYCFFVSPLVRHSLKRANLVITQTNAMRNCLLEMTGVPDKKVVAIYPAINLDIHSGKNGIRGFIYPSSPDCHKRLEIIIDAVKKAGSAFDGEILFTMTGNENNYAAKVKQTCEDIPHIRFIGYVKREKLLSYYEDYGLIFSSDVESFAIPFLEAMAYGSPIVARDTDYVKEYMYTYKNYQLYRDSDELAVMLMEYKKLRRGQGITRNRDENAWGKVIKKLLM